MSRRASALAVACVAVVVVGTVPLAGQLVDRNKAPNSANEGITRPLTGAPYPSQIGEGRTGEDWNTSANVIAYDPFRAIRRGRQLFQRKFTRLDGVGPITGDGVGDINADGSIGAGLADSCAACHGRPRGAAGFGGDVVTRPDSRDAPHLFGLGLKEMLADEITAELRAIRDQALAHAAQTGGVVSRTLASKGISFGTIRALPNGTVDTSRVEGVNADLRVRPFFAHGDTISIREFVVGALKNEMGLKMAGDPDLTAARFGPARTASGMVLNGLIDQIEAPPDEEGDVGSVEQRTALVDFLEFYLFSYFKPGTGEVTSEARRGLTTMQEIGCTTCHVQNLQINRDRRVADVETVFDPQRGHLNRLFATAALQLANPSSLGQAQVAKIPAMQPFLVANIFTDFKRHDLGPAFHERNYDGSVRTHFLTTPLWGVGTTAPYGHDGRSISLTEVILRHGGEAQPSRNAFASLNAPQRSAVLRFLESLIIFPPDDTASNLDPGDRGASGFPQYGHGSIRLGALFNDPQVVE
jgi:di-heme oxidoreductase (putative peroxidase)